MRNTSERRRNAPAGKTYRGAPKALISDTIKTADLTLPEETPGTVECEHCGARVKALVSGRPRAHAPGGLGTSTRNGRFHCPGSGTHG